MSMHLPDGACDSHIHVFDSAIPVAALVLASEDTRGRMLAGNSAEIYRWPVPLAP